MNSKLLKDAIADAKTLKETAKSNARMQLEEAFVPKIQSLVSKKLREEDEEDLEDEIEDVEDELEDIEDEGMEEFTDEESEEESMDEEEEMLDEPVEDEEEGDIDDAELEEIIKELEDEMEDEEEVDIDLEEEDEMEMDDEEEIDLEEIIREMEDEMSDEEDIDIDLEEGDYEDDEDMDLEEIIREMEDEMSDEEDVDLEMDDEEEIDLEMDDEEDAVEENFRLRTENKHLKRGIKSLKKQINEVNLLNSKLLYTNKLFNKYQLSENQKSKVIDTFDRTSTLREVKLVYSSLAESFNGLNVKKNKLTESFSSNIVGTTKPSGRKIVNSDDKFKNRMKELAGIE